MNLNAAPLDLYDYPFPSAPRWYVVRRSIAMHRMGERPPLALSPNASKEEQ